MPTANVIKGTLRALLRGKEGGSGDKLEQAHTQDGMSDAGVNTAGLSFRYAANWQCSTRGVCSVYTKSQNWISYHATWLQGLESKRAILTKVEEAWSKLSSKPANAEDDANDSLLAQCAKSLKAENIGFGNTFLGDGMKTELDAARGNPGREGGCPTGHLYCSEVGTVALGERRRLHVLLEHGVIQRCAERASYRRGRARRAVRF